MIIVLFYIAFIVLTIALIVMSMIANHHLSDEIERLKDSFEYHKKIHKYERLMAEQKIKELIQLLDKLKESTNKKKKMKIKIKKLNPLAFVPIKAHATDAGFDLYATSKTIDENRNVVYGCGLAFEIPEGYMGLVFPRSSNARTQLILSNSVGVIDAGYRGEVTAKFKSISPLHEVEYEIGERFAQIIFLPIPDVELEVAEELSESERGSGGYGSSGL